MKFAAAAEHQLDRKFANAKSTASRPGGYKSWFAVERYGHTAHLKIDYDFATNRPAAKDWRLLRYWLQERMHRVAAVRAYTTRKGLHVRVWLHAYNYDPPTLTDMEIVDATVLVNDDPWRVRFNRSRVRKGLVGWLVLWTEKWIDGKPASWETFDPVWTDRIRGWLGLPAHGKAGSPKKKTAKTRARSATCRDR